MTASLWEEEKKNTKRPRQEVQYQKKWNDECIYFGQHLIEKMEQPMRTTLWLERTNVVMS